MMFIIAISLKNTPCSIVVKNVNKSTFGKISISFFGVFCNSFAKKSGEFDLKHSDFGIQHSESHI